jgi:hypothetical protein
MVYHAEGIFYKIENTDWYGCPPLNRLVILLFKP